MEGSPGEPDGFQRMLWAVMTFLADQGFTGAHTQLVRDLQSKGYLANGSPEAPGDDGSTADLLEKTSSDQLSGGAHDLGNLLSALSPRNVPEAQSAGPRSDEQHRPGRKEDQTASRGSPAARSPPSPAHAQSFMGHEVPWGDAVDEYDHADDVGYERRDVGSQNAFVELELEGGSTSGRDRTAAAASGAAFLSHSQAGGPPSGSSAGAGPASSGGAGAPRAGPSGAASAAAGESPAPHGPGSVLARSVGAGSSVGAPFSIIATDGDSQPDEDSCGSSISGAVIDLLPSHGSAPGASSLQASASSPLAGLPSASPLIPAAADVAWDLGPIGIRLVDPVTTPTKSKASSIACIDEPKPVLSRVESLSSSFKDFDVDCIDDDMVPSRRTSANALPLRATGGSGDIGDVDECDAAPGFIEFQPIEFQPGPPATLDFAPVLSSAPCSGGGAAAAAAVPAVGRLPADCPAALSSLPPNLAQHHPVLLDLNPRSTSSSLPAVDDELERVTHGALDANNLQPSRSGSSPTRREERSTGGGGAGGPTGLGCEAAPGRCDSPAIDNAPRSAGREEVREVLGGFSFPVTATTSETQPDPGLFKSWPSVRGSFASGSDGGGSDGEEDGESEPGDDDEEEEDEEEEDAEEEDEELLGDATDYVDHGGTAVPPSRDASTAGCGGLMPCYTVGEDGALTYAYDPDYIARKYEVLQLRVYHRRNRTGFEETKDLPLRQHDLIAGRYQVVDFLGSAAFSRAVQALDTKTGGLVCLKIIKNNKDYFDQSLDEIKLLQYVARFDPEDRHGIVRLYDFFYYKEHLFLVCELLRANLYEFQKYNRESGDPPYFTPPHIQSIAAQVLRSLAFLHTLGLIHSDLKPENILMKSYSRCEVKVIDLGSSCFVTDQLSSYVQSRSYRAPEVILGLPYDHKIDIWSLGCILAELASGQVLFQNDSVATLLARLEGILGPVPPWMVAKGRYAQRFYTRSGQLYEKNPNTDRFEVLVPKRTSLRHRVPEADEGLLSFISYLLHVDPRKRPTAQQALRHPWLRQEYPPTE